MLRSDNPNDFIIDNSGASKLWGCELEIRSIPSDVIQLYTSLGYINTEFEKFLANTGDFSGNDFLFSPQVNAAIGGGYSLSDDWLL